MRTYGMPRTNLLIVAVAAVALSGPMMCASAAGDFATAQEAKALLTRAVAAVKANKTQALNSGADGFKDRDLYDDPTVCLAPRRCGD
jgi:hypothetical protein